MLVIARTVAHLLRQLRAQERSLGDLELVRGAYDFGTPLHSGRFEVDGTPFHVHALGVASIVAQLGAPASVIAAGTLHNAYTTGDWGDGRGRGPLPSRRQRLREALGADVEAVLADLGEARKRRHLADVVDGDVDGIDERARWLVLLDLADLLDKYDDGRIAYSTAGRADRDFVEGSEDDIVGLAARLGVPVLAGALESAFARTASEEIPDSLRLDRRFSVVVPAPSWQPRRSVALGRRARRLLGPVRRELSRRRPPA